MTLEESVRMGEKPREEKGKNVPEDEE